MLLQIGATWSEFNADKGARLASSVAYATICALATQLIALIADAGIVIGVENGRHEQHIAGSSAAPKAVNARTDIAKVRATDGHDKRNRVRKVA